MAISLLAIVSRSNIVICGAMDFFFHHVGGDGSKRDFPKTVFQTIPLPQICAKLPDGSGKDEITQELERSFPQGRCNVWGAPEGSKVVLKHLQVGDAFLLVGSIHWTTAIIPALGIVRVFPRTLMKTLSQELWGDVRFPRIFFFDTQRIEYHWQQFVADVGYSSNFNPHGLVYRVRSNRLSKFGGPSGYVDHLLRSAD